MKLAEALVARATLQTRLAELLTRIERNALVQEGNEPAENAPELIRQADRLLDELTLLIQRINDTNSATTLPDGRTLTHALAERDTLAKRAQLYRHAAEAGTPSQNRYSSSEIRTISTLDVTALRNRADDLAQQYRVLDTLIQATNWASDLVEQ